MRRDETAREELRRAVAYAVLRRAAHVEEAAFEGLMLGCGVSVVGTHTDYIVRADPRVPLGAVWEAPSDLGITLAADYSSRVTVEDEAA